MWQKALHVIMVARNNNWEALEASLHHYRHYMCWMGLHPVWRVNQKKRTYRNFPHYIQIGVYYIIGMTYSLRRYSCLDTRLPSSCRITHDYSEFSQHVKYCVAIYIYKHLSTFSISHRSAICRCWWVWNKKIWIMFIRINCM